MEKTRRGKDLADTFSLLHYSMQAGKMQDQPARFFGRKVPENLPKQKKPPLLEQGRFGN